MNSRQIFDVAVIGGGASGMRALAGLYDATAQQINAVLLEASAQLGGRLRRVPDAQFVPGVALDAGGEVVHGSTTELNRLAQAAGIRLDFMFTCAQGDGGPDDAPVNGMCGYYFYQAQGETSKKLYRFDALPADARAAHSALQSLGEPDDGKAKLTADQLASWSLGDYLTSLNVPSGVMALLDAGYANTCCAPSMSVMSLANTLSFEQDWGTMDGCAETSDMHTQEVGDAIADSLRALTDRVDWSRIRLNSPVIAVEQLPERGGILRLSCAKGAPPVLARVVIVAVPLKQVQAGAIRFVPPLEPRKQAAISRLPLYSARKVMLKYRAIDGVPPIWPADCESCIYADEVLPESWFHVNVPSSDGHRYHIVIGFSTARYRDAMVARFGDNDAALATAFDAQLRRVFGPSQQPPPDGHYVFDWSRDAPYIGMGYSHPSHYANGEFGLANADQWAAFAAPELAARRVWAGEYCAHPHASMTLHAALFSGAAAANEALGLLRATKPNL